MLYRGPVLRNTALPPQTGGQPNSPIYNGKTRLHKWEQGVSDGAGGRRVGGTDSVKATDSSVCGESVAAAGNHDLQQRTTSTRRATCRGSGDNTNGRKRSENESGVARELYRKPTKKRLIRVGILSRVR